MLFLSFQRELAAGCDERKFDEVWVESCKVEADWAVGKKSVEALLKVFESIWRNVEGRKVDR